MFCIKPLARFGHRAILSGMNTRTRFYLVACLSVLLVAGLYAAAPLFLHPNLNQMLTTGNVKLTSKTIKDVKQSIPTL
jgi:hypothetical protein